MVGRIPILDVTPQLEGGAYPAKAAVGESFEVSATVIREGHDALNAEVVLVDPSGRRRPPQLMQRGRHDVDRWTAIVTPDDEGWWGFEIHGWGDPVETWRHAAEIKIPAGIDTDLMFAEGVLVLRRAAQGLSGADLETLEGVIAA